MKKRLSVVLGVLLLSGSVYAKDIHIVNGWQMKGMDLEFRDMSSFDKACVDTVWTYDINTSSWRAYSPKASIRSAIESSATINNLTSISSNDGFWVNANASCTLNNTGSTAPLVRPIKTTGQTTSYTDYDDGHYQTGSAAIYTRDADVVTDGLTGLMWQDDESVKTTKKSNEEAISHCSELSFGGYSDWRLPSSTELSGIVDYGHYEPSIDTEHFQNTNSDFYWSSTSHARVDGNWIVHFLYGSEHASTSGNEHYVRCVRGGL